MTSTSPSPARYVILAAIDDSDSAQTVIERACALAGVIPGAELHVAHVAESLGIAAVTLGGSPLALPSAAELLGKAREHLQRFSSVAQQLGTVPTLAHLRVGTPWREIVQLATNLEADTLVIGTHDARGLERLLLGSRAEVIVRASPCPVMVARKKTPHRNDVPEILPPCPDCLATQRSSKGSKMWCARHSEHHPHAHVYSDAPDSFGVGSQSYRDA